MILLEIRKKKIRFISILLLVYFSCVNIFAQEENQNSEFRQDTNRLLVIWENGGRFIEFTELDESHVNMRIVLKPYYRFVYDDASKIKVDYTRIKNSESQFYLKFKYAFSRDSIALPVCVENNSFFTSFYKRVKYTENNSEPNYASRTNPMEGFWIEQGTRDGILLYPQEMPKSIDAYFFTKNSYIKFRYWLDDLVYSKKKAIVKGSSGKSYEFPKLLKRGKYVYSCVTSNGSVLRNFETGVYSINGDKNAADGKGLSLTLKKQGAGPGSDAVADVYPHQRFIEMKNLPLYILDRGQVFSIGDAYLLRSSITNLDAEIKAHNSKRRK